MRCWIRWQSGLDAHLSQGIPALSPPVGRTNLAGAGTQYMVNSWPRLYDGQLGGRFLHSDFKNVAYFFVYPVFQKIIETGGLNQ